MNEKTILITGGSAGIGRALAVRLHGAGNTVLICGRDETKLAAAREELPGLGTFVADMTSAEDRERLVAWATGEYRLDAAILNAGVMTFPDFAGSPELAAIESELATNLTAPIHLTSLLVPHLRARPETWLGFVSSGLAFVPLAASPVYCATKAAIHSFAQTVRHQLAATSIRVVEIIPPLVNTDIGFPGRNTTGMPVEEFVDAVISGLEARKDEIAVGYSERARLATKEERDAMFAARNDPAPSV